MPRKRGNGEGTVYRRKDGRWVGQYLVYTSKGPKYRYIYGRTRADVSKKLTKAMADRDGGLDFDAGSLTIGEYLDRWLTDTVKGTVRTSTFERHEQIIRGHLTPALGRVKLKTLTPAHVRSVHREKLEEGLSPVTVRKIHSNAPQGALAGRSGRLRAPQRRRGEGAAAGARRDAPAIGSRSPYLSRCCPRG